MSHSVVEEYRLQASWRQWRLMLDHVKLAGVVITGATVLDLGCGAGDVSALLGEYGADLVLGVDRDAELIKHATREVASHSVQFLCGDVTEAEPIRGRIAQHRERGEAQDGVDGIWSSFCAAYFLGQALEHALVCWREMLRPGGWIVVIEINGLFSYHSPMESAQRAQWRHVERMWYNDGVYDALAGGKLMSLMISAGFENVSESRWSDRELSFTGPIESAPLAGWQRRLRRVSRIGEYFESSDAHEACCKAFLECLQHERHLMDEGGEVRMVLGFKPR